MDWGKVRFFLGEVGRNFSRNATMQITAIGTVAVMTVMLGAFLFTQATMRSLGDQIFKQIQISVFIADPIDVRTETALRLAAARDRRVRSVAFIPKTQGLREMRDRLRGQIDTSLLASNPLPDALRVKVRRPQDVAAVARGLAKMPGVAKVVYAEETVAKMIRLGAVLSRASEVLLALLVGVAAIIISNTVRLTVFARRREIAIMRLVGASSAYIRGPFLCEGLLTGVLGSGIAIGILAAARSRLLPKLQSALPFVPLTPASFDVGTLALELLGIGALVGIVASWISLGRYLRV